MYEKKRDRQGQLERDKANTLENERNRRGQLKRDAASAALEVLKYAKASYNVVKFLPIEWIESIFKNLHSQSTS